jgi:hypothetical protein
MRQRESFLTCVQPFSVEEAITHHYPLEEIIHSARRRMFWAQHRVVGSVQDPPSEQLKFRIIAAGSFLENSFTEWVDSIELHEAKRQSCIKVNTLKAIETVLRNFEDYTRRRDESVQAYNNLIASIKQRKYHHNSEAIDAT